MDEQNETQNRIKKLEEELDPYKLTPRIIDIAIRARGDKTPYVSGGNTIECDVVLELEWQGRRYKIPAFET
jgi:hypothetical protein